jgi:SET domain-containing protein
MPVRLKSRPLKAKTLDAWLVKSSKIQGLGVFAKRQIVKDELLGEVEGTEHHFSTLDAYDLSMSFESRTDHYIVADPESIGRYLNHSDAPNCRVVGLKIIAGRDIGAGEELTIDYFETTTWKDYKLPWLK